MAETAKSGKPDVTGNKPIVTSLSRIPRPFVRVHGMTRGLDAVPRSTSFEGRFGRMFRTLPPAEFSLEALKSLAAEQHMIAEDEGNATPETDADDEENAGPDRARPAISAGYTYWGQFIDHDLTFDPASSLQQQNDPDGLEDFRSPRFDLDNIYGRGPDDQPYMYADDGVRILLGRKLSGNSGDGGARDLARTAGGRAIIGDPRNDENVIVSQLQATFIRFHNRVADVMGADDPDDFKEVQQTVRFHYQWAVLMDFLKTIIGEEMLNDLLPHLRSKTKNPQETPPNLRWYEPKKDLFMPVEFSVAAYRFGHSMIRPQYRLNELTPKDEAVADNDKRLPIFSPGGEFGKSLVGFGTFPDSWAVDWRLFFNMGSNAPALGRNRIQPAYKIDTSLVNPLGKLPHQVVLPTGPISLAERNLVRGLRMGLPSGQAVAQAMGVPVIDDKNLRVGKANEDDFEKNPTLVSISPEFEGNSPLWFYILAEAMQTFKDNKSPLHLGSVGGRIVGEVFVGLMWNDGHSFLNQKACWTPRSDFLNKTGEFGIAELITQAMQAKDVS